MRISCILSSAILIILGICGGVWAISGFNLLYFICFYNITIARCVLAAGGVCALFLVFAIVQFRPFYGLK